MRIAGLAQQTEQGIGAVNAQAGQIDETTRATVATVAAVARSIRDIDAISGEVARAADEQRAATAEIMASAAQAADQTRSVAETVALMQQNVKTTDRTAQQVSELSERVNRDIASLQRRLYIILRTSYGGDRRIHRRATVSIPFTARFGDQTCEGYTGDLSIGGALLVARGDPIIMTASAGELTLEGLPRMRCRLISQDSMGLHVQFMSIDTPEMDAVNAVMERSVAADEIYVAAARSMASEASGLLQTAVEAGEISLKDLFDTDYQPIAETQPVQYLAKHTALAERLFPSLIEPPLAHDSQIVFCCITDHNGYIAAHNRKFSEPQRTDDAVWNAAHARNRRIYDDTTGILAARGTKPRVLTYNRDMGGGNFVILKEVDAPIQVGERHWGAVRMALKL